MKKYYRPLHEVFTNGYNLLLVFLGLLLIFRPFQHGTIYIALWELCFAAVFFIAIFVCPQPRIIKRTAAIVGIPALIFGWAGLIHSTLFLIIPYICLTILFMLLCTAAVVYREIVVTKASWSTLTPIICAYFLIGYAFAYGYLIIEIVYPGSLKLSNPGLEFFANGEYLAQAVLLSFASLLSVNGLDYTDVNPMMSMILIEGLLSQFYLAALTSHIVGIFRNARKNREEEKKEQEKVVKI